MSVRSSEPKSNLDKVAYVINILVIISAIISVVMALFFIRQATIYEYYFTYALILLLSSLFSVTFAILGFRFIIRTIRKNKMK